METVLVFTLFFITLVLAVCGIVFMLIAIALVGGLTKIVRMLQGAVKFVLEPKLWR